MGMLRAANLVLGILTLLTLTSCAFGRPPIPMGSASNAESATLQGEKIFEARCVFCHSGPNPKGGYDVSSYQGIMSDGRVIPFDPQGSLLIQLLRSGEMPPAAPLREEEIASLEAWISAGALPFDDGPPLQPPVANAGTDQAVTLPMVDLRLTGTATDSDGTIKSVQWMQISGPNLQMAGADTLNLVLNNLIAGTYVYQLTVVDNHGLSHSDSVQLTVSAPANVPPTVSAGADVAISLPVTSVNLVGSAADADGSIVNYQWIKVSGGAATMTGANLATLTASGLTAGTYVYRLTATDNSGSSAMDEVTVTVNTADNTPPLVNAGSDISINLPISTASVTGTASDADGTISDTTWSQVTGPAPVTIVNRFSLQTQLQGLNVAGSYSFQLSATDSGGAVAVDTVIITAIAAPNTLPSANAGTDKSIMLPTNSVVINGSGSDSNGSISSFAWRQVSGPSNAILSGAATANLTANSLVQGTYVFELKVTDNVGGTAVDTVNVMVEALVNPNATFTWISANVLQPKCLKCHGAGGKAGFDIRTYSGTLAKVRAGSSAQSLLFTTVDRGSMPEGGPKLPADQIKAIKDWIDLGALNN